MILSLLDYTNIMSFIQNLDLNLPPREDEVSAKEEEISTHVDEEHSNKVYLFDLNTGNIYEHLI